MFGSLTDKLSGVFDRLRGKGFLNEDDINTALRDVRIALIEADVAIPAIKALMARVKERALGQEVFKSVTPGQMIAKYVHDELAEFLGEPAPLSFKANSPFSYVFVGLQGAGKTTSVAKVAKYLTNFRNVMTASLDVHRPAAQEQLAELSESVGVKSLPIDKTQKPLAIVKRAIEFAKKENIDIILFDTAGRLHIDDEMMQELVDIHGKVAPVETLLVLDSLMGQDAINTANAFGEKVPLTGLIFTRADGDARGGAILSARFATGCPVKFLGTGEHVNKLELFDSTRIADQILGMGDIVKFVEAAEKLASDDTANRLQKRMEKGIFNLNDMLTQLDASAREEGLSDVLGAGFLGKETTQLLKAKDSKLILRQNAALIRSMTPKERANYKILNASRRRRIAAGAGQTVADLNKFLKAFEATQALVKRVSKGKGLGELFNMLRSARR
ncbi:MAG: signal recognition particle protein Srp54 [Holosporales bacterium]|jgi:signal recognition particle subunit SRP54|nr:signal recognition particle protein Srp54 [Holosporales bacterium]